MTDRTAAGHWSALRGVPEPPDKAHLFDAGALAARLSGVDVAGVRDPGRELVRRVGVRVRDPDWGTIPPAVDDLELGTGSASFSARHASRDIDFAWEARIGLDGHGLTYEMSGRALKDFDYNRIGLIVLHPPQCTAGQRYRARSAGGERLEGQLSTLIAPQLIRDGEVRPLFPAFTRLEIEFEASGWLVFEFEGDLFEMEDQRNWTDGSFKTYSTPVGLPVPHRAREGQEIHQRVRLELADADRRRPRQRATDARVELHVGSPLGARFPAVGIGADEDAHEPAGREIECLRGLLPAHLCVELNGEGWQHALEQAAGVAGAIGAALELTLVLEGDRRAALAVLESLAEALRPPMPALARLIVLHAGEEVTERAWVELSRTALALPAQVPLIAGTWANFAELNRNRPPAELPADGLAYAITPQVHDSDDESIMQTLPVQRDTVATARSFAGARSIHVSPVTLRPRPNPYATRRAVLPPRGEPPHVDPRQRSLLAAAWTAASAKQLAAGGAASVTYYAATGPLGLMDRVGAEARPFLFPVYHVLREVCSWSGAELLDCRSARPERVELGGVDADGARRLIAANLTPEPQRVSLGPLPSGRVVATLLEAPCLDAASSDPEHFARPVDSSLEKGAERLELELGPYGLARILVSI